MHSSFCAMLARIARPAVAFTDSPMDHTSAGERAAPQGKAHSSLGCCIVVGDIPLRGRFGLTFHALSSVLLVAGQGSQGGREKSKPIGNRPVPCLERTTPCKLSQEKKKSGAVAQATWRPVLPQDSTESAPRAQGPDFFSHFTFTPCCALKVPARHPVLVSSIHKKHPPF